MKNGAERSEPAEPGEETQPAAHRSPVALLLIDVINPMDFPGGDLLLRSALPASVQIALLKEHAHERDVPVIYVNDNFDCWHLGFDELVEWLRERRVPGKPIIDRLRPEPGRDFYILKPSHSGFFRTPLEVLLDRLGARTLVFCGYAGDICVLFTANDAYMRGFEIVIPADCVASERAEDDAAAVRQMQRLLKAKVTDAATLVRGDFSTHDL